MTSRSRADKHLALGHNLPWSWHVGPQKIPKGIVSAGVLPWAFGDKLKGRILSDDLPLSFKFLGSICNMDGVHELYSYPQR